jgi:hypothetical protein
LRDEGYLDTVIADTEHHLGTTDDSGESWSGAAVAGVALSQVAVHRGPLVGGVLAAGLHRLLYPEADETLASGDLPMAGVD